MINNTQQTWQQQLKNCITSKQELLTMLELPVDNSVDNSVSNQEKAVDFPLRVPKAFANKMQKGRMDDPLLLQVLPRLEENVSKSGYIFDPLLEYNVNKTPGMLQKYHGRVLLTISGACAIHCRYCFRRHFPYASNNPGTKGWQEVFEKIAVDNSIKEVILSGGDPLLLSDNHLTNLVNQIAKIPHITRIRIHTRTPVVIPERITDELLQLIHNTKVAWVMVVHVNHANELDDNFKRAMQLLSNAGVTLLNQSVLLHDVNDSVIALENLSEALFQCGILPYYLHLLDKVAGAWHFDVDENKAKELMQQLVGRLPGYLVPKLVCEQAGMISKTVIF